MESYSLGGRMRGRGKFVAEMVEDHSHTVVVYDVTDQRDSSDRQSS